MKKITIIAILTTLMLSAWEINTHRAIDRKAVENSTNLIKFIENSNIPLDNNYYNNEKFEGYGISYIQYIEDDKKGEGNGVAQWGQTFGDKPSWQNMIEAGSILEDALWPNALFAGDGRFNNHFADPQINYRGLWLWKGMSSALLWAWDRFDNQYDYMNALEYFKDGFVSKQLDERRRYQAKMLVSVGHILHLMNDMNVPAHTRDDAHPNGDAFRSLG